MKGSVSISPGTDSPDSGEDQLDFAKTISFTVDHRSDDGHVVAQAQHRYSEIEVLSTLNSVDNDF